jgi:hypothetical protein
MQQQRSMIDICSKNTGTADRRALHEHIDLEE